MPARRAYASPKALFGQKKINGAVLRHEGKIESKKFEQVETDSRAQNWGNLHPAYLRCWEF
ncbi:MAG: hypothetical protein EAZ39_13730 [Oscillatoriales cyanobacterium]|nr:MAG: hypothetical protein EAZ39_13730 [Oscillatoriales cyanobacterium]TAG45490.1 MAG: hypothetical protein EAZ33_07450 [Oscillatoriales cyanobacterium]TAG60475.1 MAG: hypothetical protein EAZ28_07050 [Oscillatoriales cyanobacterium]